MKEKRLPAAQWQRKHQHGSKGNTKTAIPTTGTSETGMKIYTKAFYPCNASNKDICFSMNLLMRPLLRLLFCIPLAPAISPGSEYLIDFGTSEYARRYTSAAKKFAVRTTAAGWNNISVTTQMASGSVSLSSTFFKETVATDSASVIPTYGQTSVNTVSIYNTGGNIDSALTLSITKNTSIGSLSFITSANAPSANKILSPSQLDWVPTTAYGDYIFTNENNGGSGAFTLTLGGINAGLYDLTIIAGGNSYMGSVYGGNAASGIYTLNGNKSCTITGTDAAGGGYAGVIKWKRVKVEENGVLTLTVEGGYLGNEGGVDKYATAAINSLILATVPEPASATLSLLALAGLAARRRRASR